MDRNSLSATLSVPLSCWHESLESARSEPVTELSVDGAFIMSDRPLSPGLPVFLELALGTAANPAIGYIDAIVSSVAKNGTAGFGVRFVDLDDSVRIWIQRHVAANLPVEHPAPKPAPVAADEEFDPFELEAPPAWSADNENPDDPFQEAARPPESFSEESFNPFNEESAPPGNEPRPDFNEGSVPGLPVIVIAQEELEEVEPVESFGFFDEPSNGGAFDSFEGSDFEQSNPFGAPPVTPSEDLQPPIDPFEPRPTPSPQAGLEGLDIDLSAMEDEEPLELSSPSMMVDPGLFAESEEAESFPVPQRSALAELSDEETGDSGFETSKPQTQILGSTVEQTQAFAPAPARPLRSLGYSAPADSPAEVTQAFAPVPTREKKPVLEENAPTETQSFSVAAVHAAQKQSEARSEAPVEETQAFRPIPQARSEAPVEETQAFRPIPRAKTQFSAQGIDDALPKRETLPLGLSLKDLQDDHQVANSKTPAMGTLSTPKPPNPTPAPSPLPTPTPSPSLVDEGRTSTLKFAAIAPISTPPTTLALEEDWAVSSSEGVDELDEIVGRPLDEMELPDDEPMAAAVPPPKPVPAPAPVMDFLSFEELSAPPVGSIELPLAKLQGGQETVSLEESAFPDFDLPLDPFSTDSEPWRVSEPAAETPPPPEELPEFTDEDSVELDLDGLDEAWVVATKKTE